MLVYRVEKFDKFGPYRGNPTGNPKCLKKLDADFCRHPLPKEDGLYGNVDQRCCFGFKSLDSVVDWFDEIIDELANEGWYISIYKIKKKFIRFGRRQIYFRKDRAIHVGYANK